jgi:MIP family channel proteins
MKRTTLKQELLAEFLGTFILVTFGVAVVAQVILSEGKNGGYLSINLGWGLAVVMGVYVAGGVTGAHLNPAVTLALAVRRGFAWGKLFPYWVAQVAGGFVASAAVFITYHDAFNAFDKGTRSVLGDRGTAGIFATYPQPFLSTTGGFIDQLVGTALLILVILAVTDSNNTGPSQTLAPIVIGLLVVLIGMTFGLNCGYAINPARDLGPRLFTWVGGWGTEVFRAANCWFWVPIVGPLLGGILGALVYDGFVGNYLKK